jgi:polysaccharide deacetylase 2 family uncharacterized protein YibQ
MLNLATLWPRLGVYAAIAAILLGLGAGTCWYFAAGTIADLKAVRDAQAEQLRLVVRSRLIDQKVSQQRAITRQGRASEAAGAAAKDAAALAKAKTWADTPVPQEVLDALQ